MSVSVFDLSCIRVYVSSVMCLCMTFHVSVSMYELSWRCLHSSAHPVLTIRPSTVVITGVDEHHVVTALCRIRPAVGQLVSLQLTRWSSVSDATVILVQATANSELYTINLPAAVARGGFSQRFINYTFLQVRDFIVTLRYRPNSSSTTPS